MEEHHFGNPWIFKEILTGAKDSKVSEEVNKMILKHFKMLVEQKGEYTAVREMRKHIAWYIKGFPNATEIRRLVNGLEKIEEIEKIFR